MNQRSWDHSPKGLNPIPWSNQGGMQGTQPKGIPTLLQDIPKHALILKNYPLQSRTHCWYRMSQLFEV